MARWEVVAQVRRDHLQLYQNLSGPEPDFHKNLQLQVEGKRLWTILPQNTVPLPRNKGYLVWWQKENKGLAFTDLGHIKIKQIKLQSHVKSNQLVFLNCRNRQGTLQHCLENYLFRSWEFFVTYFARWRITFPICLTCTLLHIWGQPLQTSLLLGSQEVPT